MKLLRACAAHVSKAERVVEVAAAGVSNWSSHVQARTDMLEGRISERQMEAVWNRTQHAGPVDQRRFHAAMQAYDSKPRCGQLNRVPAAHRHITTDCVRRSQSATRALAAAEKAMGDWKIHLANMAKYAHGKMSASLAQGKWVKAWRNAPTNISAYRDARTTLNHAPPCKVPIAN